MKFKEGDKVIVIDHDDYKPGVGIQGIVKCVKKHYPDLYIQVEFPFLLWETHPRKYYRNFFRENQLVHATKTAKILYGREEI